MHLRGPNDTGFFAAAAASFLVFDFEEARAVFSLCAVSLLALVVWDVFTGSGGNVDGSSADDMLPDVTEFFNANRFDEEIYSAVGNASEDSASLSIAGHHDDW
jgi:hypothetical protein